MDHHKLAGIFVIAIFQILLAASQTKFSLTEETSTSKSHGKKQIPTFVGSDGIVRKVSPATILEEMKRCLPPGIPIPIDSVWPELPPDTDEVQDNGTSQLPSSVNGSGNNGVDAQAVIDRETLRKLTELQGNRRVSRSENTAVGSRASSRNGIDKLDGERESVIFSPTLLNPSGLTEVLKELLANQLKNASKEFVGAEDHRERKFQPKIKNPSESGYIDYDYEEINTTPSTMWRSEEDFNYEKSKRTNAIKNRRFNKKKPTNKGNVAYRMPPSRPNARKSPPKDWNQNTEYEYDYEESGEDFEKISSNEMKPSSMNGFKYNEELKRLCGLKNYLQTIASKGGNCELDGEANESKRSKQTNTTLLKSEKNCNKNLLSVVLDLNASLVNLLENLICSAATNSEKKGNNCQQAMNQNIEEKDEEVLLDWVDLLMQQRRGFRETHKQSMVDESDDNSSFLTHRNNARESSKGSTRQRDVKLLKWLLKSYFAVDPPKKNNNQY